MYILTGAKAVASDRFTYLRTANQSSDMANLQNREPRELQEGSNGIVRRWDHDSNTFHGQPFSDSPLQDRAEQVLDLLLRRKWLIITTCFLVLAGAAVYTYTQVPLYQASSLVLIERDNGGASQLGIQSPSSKMLLAGGGGSLQNELVILRNSRSLRRRVAERIVDRGLAKRYVGSPTHSKIGTLSDRAWSMVREFFDMERSGAVSKIASSSNDSSESSDGRKYSVGEIASRLGGQVQFGLSQQTSDAIRITAVDEDPELVADLVNLYTEEYVELTREASRAQVSATRAFLQKQAEKHEEDLRSIERQVQAYKRREGAVALDSRGQNLVNQISNLETEIEKARLELQMEKKGLSSLEEQLQSIQPEDLSELVGSSYRQEIEALQSRIAELKMSKQELLLQSDSPSPTDSTQVAQIDHRIGRLQTQVSSLADEYVDEIMSGGVSAEASAERLKNLRRRIADKRITISGLEARIDILTDRLQATENEFRSVPEKAMELARLRRQQGYAEQMYQYVMRQLQNARVQEKSELGYANSVSKATAPGQLVRPRPERNLMLGLLLGILGGLGLALIRDVLDNRFYKPDRLGELGYREIGTIPNLEPVIDDRLGGEMVVKQDGMELQTSLISAVEPNSAAAEAYRQLRTNIDYGGVDEIVGTLVVTSPGAGDGKSVTAGNLAIVMAQAGKSTLLVDTDFRRPQIHRLFGGTQSPGLSDALQNGVNENIRSPEINNLSVLPAGAMVNNPSEIVGSSRFRQFLRGAQEHFDVIVLDTPPVLATTDASLLSTQADATLCVVRAGRTTEAELDRAMNTLGEVGARVTGVVFNGFDVAMAYGYRYRYRHYDEYGHYDHYSSLPRSE